MMNVVLLNTMSASTGIARPCWWRSCRRQSEPKRFGARSWSRLQRREEDSRYDIIHTIDMYDNIYIYVNNNDNINNDIM